MRKIVTLMLVLLFCFTASAFADSSENREMTIPSTVSPGLKHLLGMVASGNAGTLNIQAVAPVLEFVAAAKNPEDIYVSDDSFESPSAYYEFDLNLGLADFLQISQNPKIPNYLMKPSSMRLGYWKEISEGEESYANLWEHLSNLMDPVVVRGVGTAETTPDIHTGTYYKYDLDRTMILFKHQGRNVFVSLSRQKGQSEVGKKGVVVGDDEDWNYLYSGEKGINKTGLRWVDSYMYGSSSIILFYEPDPDNPMVKCAVFKWLRAGWKNINMVRNHHIYRGMQRWAADLKTIIEHPEFPGAEELVQAFLLIEKIDLAELKQANHLYYQSLEKRYAEDKSVSSRWESEVLKDYSRVDGSNVHELRSVVVMEYLKSVIGKQHEIDVISRYGLKSEANLVEQ